MFGVKAHIKRYLAHLNDAAQWAILARHVDMNFLRGTKVSKDYFYRFSAMIFRME